MALKHRLRKLEGRGLPCPGCGSGGPEKPEIEIYWPDIDGEPAPEGFPEENEYCAACGEPLHLIITWGDIDLEEEEFDPLRSEKLRQQRENPDER